MQIECSRPSHQMSSESGVYRGESPGGIHRGSKLDIGIFMARLESFLGPRQTWESLYSCPGTCLILLTINSAHKEDGGLALLASSLPSCLKKNTG